MTLPRLCGPPAASGVLRQRPQDFFVDEILSFEPDGEGEHELVHVEKTGANTAWVAGALARFAGVRPRDVSYAGRKDRHAVTRQWFSVWLPGRSGIDWADCGIEGVEILGTVRHRRKLRRGALAGNRFRIVIREFRNGDDIEARCERLVRDGVPNYFGPQRFGHGRRNLELAVRLFEGARLRRNERSIALSAARSEIFNAVLAARIDAGTFLVPLPGEPLSPGGGSFFSCEQPDEEIIRRVGIGELHPTGPMWGDGGNPATGEAAAFEAAVAAQFELFCSGLAGARLRFERRPLRVIPQELAWQVAENGLELRFLLPRGAFATCLVAELVEVPASE